MLLFLGIMANLGAGVRQSLGLNDASSCSETAGETAGNADINAWAFKRFKSGKMKGRRFLSKIQNQKSEIKRQKTKNRKSKLIKNPKSKI